MTIVFLEFHAEHTPQMENKYCIIQLCNNKWLLFSRNPCIAHMTIACSYEYCALFWGAKYMSCQTTTVLLLPQAKHMSHEYSTSLVFHLLLTCATDQIRKVWSISSSPSLFICAWSMGYVTQELKEISRPTVIPHTQQSLPLWNCYSYDDSHNNNHLKG